MKKDKNQTPLEMEIEDRTKELSTFNMGSDEYNKAVESLAVLMKCQNDGQKVSHERRDTIVKNSLTAAGIVLPLAVAIWGTCSNMAFETDGYNLSTTMGRGWLNKLLPKK